MTELEKAKTVFPRELWKYIEQIPPEQMDCVQEIRLRRGQPITLTGCGGCRYLSLTGRLSDRPYQALLCMDEWLDQTLDNACDHSVYAHQEELRRGYIATRNGYRIGVAGTAIMKDGSVTGFRNVTSLCLRVARDHAGCANDIVPLVYRTGQLHSTLICGEPSCGKTSLLKDLLRSLAKAGIYAAVIDERGELSSCGVTAGCDVLSYVPKAVGIEQAVRCLAPPLLVLDELGNDEEINAVVEGLYRGVPAVATIHCRNAEDLIKRTSLEKALRNGLFEYLIFLEGRARPGQIERCLKTEDWLRERDWDITGAAYRSCEWNAGAAALAATGSGIV